jgi:hypothetical protein
MIIQAFQPEHLDTLTMQPAQQYLRQFITPEVVATVSGHPAWTALVDEEPVACVGVIPVWPGRALAWCYLSDKIGRHMTAVTRAVRRGMDVLPHRRIEITVDEGFVAGHRWANMLGFHKEADKMAAYRPDGGACSLYARVRT